MKTIIESHIPYIKGALEPFGEVVYLEPEQFTPEAVADADALVVRTRTRCDAALLDGSNVKFVGTATIGTDHIDLNYCASRGIKVASAPGCNAPAVAQYVLAHVGRRIAALGVAPSDCTIGIVGVGHIGRIIERWAAAIGFKILLCDPPRAIAEGADRFVSLAEIAERADVITFHTPLTRSGDYPTFHICNTKFVASLKRCHTLINAARGAVFDTAAVIEAPESIEIVTDCWEGEPAISPILLAKSALATPHIAGYSLQGKMRATAMVLQALKQHFALGIDVDKVVATPPVDEHPSLEQIMASCNLENISEMLKSHPADFESLRNNYKLRSEP